MVSETSPSKRETRASASPVKPRDDISPSTEAVEKLQKAVVSAQLTVGKDVDEDWNIVSVQWLAQAKKYLNEGGANKTAHPGAIDNSQLIETEDGTNYLREGLTENVDYDFIPAELWKELVEVFGCEGGEERQVIRTKTYVAQSEFATRIEARPTVVECVKFPDVKNVVKIRASRAYTVDPKVAVRKPQNSRLKLEG